MPKFKPILPFGHRGISLIEVAVVAGILGVLFIVLGRFFSTSSKVALEARQNDAANQIAEKIASDLRKINFYYVMGADSDMKSGTSLTVNHTDYMVDWSKSQMKGELEKFEQMVREAGFDRFRIECLLMFRPKTTSSGNSFSYQYFSSYSNLPTVDMIDPTRMQFIDRNSDGQYYNSIYNVASKTWSPELPPIEIKEMTIYIYKNGRPVRGNRGVKSVRLDLNDYSQDPTDSAASKIKLIINRPSGLNAHERVTVEERTSLDLPIARPPAPIYGLTEVCRESRFDRVTDGVHGYGGMVVQGQTLVGATVRITHYGGYTACPSCNYQLTPYAWNRFQEMIVTDPNGIFTMILNDSMMEAITSDRALIKTSYSGSIQLIGRATLNGETSSDFWHQYGIELSTKPTYVTAYCPTTLTVKTLAPVVGFQASSPPVLNNLSFTLDGIAFVGRTVQPWIYSVSGVPPYSRLPPILGDGPHSVEVSYMDMYCYRATATWVFSVAVDPDPSPPVVTLVGPLTSTGFSGGQIVKVEDPESGVDYRTISILLDGMPYKDFRGNTGPGLINNGYDPITGRIVLSCYQRLSPGPHQLIITVSNFSPAGPATTTETLGFIVP